MLGMCGRRQHKKKPVFNPTHRAPSTQTRARFERDFKKWQEYKRRLGVSLVKITPAWCVLMKPRRSFLLGNTPAEAQMVCSVVGGTVERSAAGRRRSMNRRLGPSLGARLPV